MHKIKFSDVFVLGVGFWVEGSAPFRSGYVRILNNNVVFKRSNTTRIVYVCEVIGGADVVSSNTCFLFTLLKMSLCKIDFKCKGIDVRPDRLALYCSVQTQTPKK